MFRAIVAALVVLLFPFTCGALISNSEVKPKPCKFRKQWHGTGYRRENHKSRNKSIPTKSRRRRYER